MNLDTHGLAWAAGFTDGEGCFSYMRHTGPRYGQYVYPTFTVGQTNPEPLERLARALGVGHVSGPQAPSGQGKLPVWTYRLTNPGDVQWAICAMWPWLSGPKRQQAVRVMRECRDSIMRLGRCFGGHDRTERSPVTGLCRACNRERARRLADRVPCPSCGGHKNKAATVCRKCWHSQRRDRLTLDRVASLGVSAEHRAVAPVH